MIKRIINNPFARNSLALFAGTTAANFLNYLFHLAVGRMVSPGVYGEVESLIALTNIITIPALALSMVATKYSAGFKAENDPQGNRKFMNYLNKRTAQVVIPLFLLAILFTPAINKFFKFENSWPILLLWMLMLISFFSAISGGVLAGWQKFKEVSWSLVMGSFFKLIVAVVLISAGFAIGGIMGSFVFSALASYLTALFFLKFIINSKEDNDTGDNSGTYAVDLKAMKNYIWPVLACNLALTILSNADMVIARHNIDAISAGQYGALTVVSKIILFATGVVVPVLFSMSAEKHHKKTDSTGFLRQAILIVSSLSLVALGFYFFTPKLVMWFLFGSKYFAVSGYLGWLAVAVVLFSLTNLVAQYMLSLQKTGLSYILLIFSGIFIIVLLFGGYDISAIIKITVAVQLAALAASLAYLFKNRESKYLSINNP